MLEKIRKILLETPGLRAKEIARKTGLEKTSVNSFLYSHKDAFARDDNFCWSLMAPSVLELGSHCWVTANSFEQSLFETGCLLSSDSQSVMVKIPDRCKIMLIVGARLLSLINQLAYNGKNVTIDLIDSANTKNFLSRAGFFDLLDATVDVIPSKPKFSAAKIYQGNSDALVEFGAIDPGKKNKDLVTQLVKRFVQQSDERFETAAFTVFSELIGNVRDHSGSPIHGFAALQKYGGSKPHIQTVVSDSGVGISKTLRPSLKEHYPDLFRLYDKENVDSDAGLVETALSRGGISRSGSGYGLGFKSSRGQAIKFDAEYSVRQERFCLNFKYKNGKLLNVERRLNLPKILGTHLCFDFFVD